MPSFLAYRPDLAEALLALWHDATGDAYPVPPALWHAITAGDPSFEPGDLLVARGEGAPLGFVLTKRYRGDYPGCERCAETGWIALLAVAPQAWGQGIGRALLAGAQARLRGRGATSVVLGGSFHHPMPGVPAGWETARAFFATAGYETFEEVWDVRRDLRADPPLPPAIAPPGHELRPFRAGEEASLEGFLRREFPGRWPRDVMHGLATGAPIGDVYGAFRAGEPVGFAQLGPPDSRVALRWAGFEPGIAALGPIGIAASARGAGLGLALLLGGLHELRNRGAGPTVIDWTDLLDFYARAGFAPWLHYVRARKTLP